jgi:hypothetical protein
MLASTIQLLSMSEKLKAILAELQSRFEEIYGDRFFYVMRLKERSLHHSTSRLFQSEPP